jgi:hypothetical protein
VDRRQIVRERRLTEAVEQLEFERERRAMLDDQLRDNISELEAWQTDETVLAGLDPALAECLRESGFAAERPDDEERQNLVEEIARLEEEIGRCGTRQAAFEAYIAALESAPPA